MGHSGFSRSLASLSRLYTSSFVSPTRKSGSHAPFRETSCAATNAPHISHGFWSTPVKAISAWFNRPGASTYRPTHVPAPRHTDSQGLGLPCLCQAHHRINAMPRPSQPASRLRIMREFDTTISRASAGRMVISGRMADVCAELDRLVQLESAA